MAAKINESLKRDSVQAPPTRSIGVAVAEEDRHGNNDFANERLREPQQSRDLILLRDDTEPAAARALDGITCVSPEIRKMRLSPRDTRSRERDAASCDATFANEVMINEFVN